MFANRMLRRALLAPAPSLRSPPSPLVSRSAVALSSHLRQLRAFSVATSEQEILNASLESEAVPVDSDSTGLWVNNIYRLGPMWYWFRQALKPLGLEIGQWKQKRAESQLAAQLATFDLSRVHFISRLRDGGVFIFFASPADAQRAKLELRAKGFDGRAVECFSVQGTPFIEDMLLSAPSSRVAVTLPAEGVAVETLYPIFRQFGRIHALTVDKDVARVTYGSARPAIAARNCLHLASLAGLPGAMRVQFEQYLTARLAEYAKSSKFLPFLAVLLTVVIALLVDPLRLVNVTQKIALHWGDDEDERGRVTRARPQPPVARPEAAELHASWSERPDAVFLLDGPPGTGKSTMLRSLMDGRSLCIRIDCARAGLTTEGGSANDTSFVDQLERALNFAPSFSTLTNITAYFESFFPVKRNALSSSVLYQLRSILLTLSHALKVVSTTYPSEGAKRPFPYAVIVFDSFHELLQSMEDASGGADKAKAQALFEVLLQFIVKTTQVDHTAHVVLVSSSPLAEDTLNKFPDLRGRMKVVRVGDVDAHRAAEFLRDALPPSVVAEVAAETAAAAASTQLSLEQASAGDTDADGSGADAPPEEDVQSFSVFSILSAAASVGRRVVGLGPKGNQSGGSGNAGAGGNPSGSAQDPADATADNANPKAGALYDQHLAHAHRVLGGRISDLDSLAFRVRSGRRSVPDALDDMVREAQKETAGAAFGGVLFKEQGKKRWTQVHAWRCASRLARAPYGIEVGGVPQKDMLFDVFKGDKDALKAMVNANLLAIESRVVAQGGSSSSAAASSSSSSASVAPAPNGADKKVVQYCVPISPLQHAAYQRIVGDAAFAARMRQHCADADAAELNEKIAAVELELLRLEQGRARGAGAELRGAMLDAELAALTRAVQAQKESEQL